MKTRPRMKQLFLSSERNRLLIKEIYLSQCLDFRKLTDIFSDCRRKIFMLTKKRKKNLTKKETYNFKQ